MGEPTNVLNVLSLFAGIGGLDLGLEYAGMRVVGQVEINPFCRQVLDKHWPEVPKHDDVRTAAEWWASQPRPAVHVIAGGFPCQPFSTAGRRQGEADERWAWPWFSDVIRALRPRYVVVENVAALLRDSSAFGRILGDLAKSGYDTQWDCIPASAVGAPHSRDRLFLVSNSNGERRHGRPSLPQTPEAAGWLPPQGSDAWCSEPDVGRVAHGVPMRVDRIKGLGNAVVPQVAEHIGRLIVAAVA